MECHVYRSRKKSGTYLFLPEKDNFAAVPDTLLTLFGMAEFSFSFELDANKKLTQADGKEVLRNIQQNGFYLHLPTHNDLQQAVFH